MNLVALDGGGARHLVDEGYETRETNLVQGPVFSSDGRLVAISEGFVWWWLPDDVDSPEGTPSPGGTLRRGRVTAIEIDSGSVRQVDVFGEVAEGWVPPHDSWEHFELLGKPRFISGDELLVTPEFGQPVELVLPS